MLPYFVQNGTQLGGPDASGLSIFSFCWEYLWIWRLHGTLVEQGWQEKEYFTTQTRDVWKDDSVKTLFFPVLQTFERTLSCCYTSHVSPDSPSDKNSIEIKMRASVAGIMLTERNRSVRMEAIPGPLLSALLPYGLTLYRNWGFARAEFRITCEAVQVLTHREQNLCQLERCNWMGPCDNVHLRSFGTCT